MNNKKKQTSITILILVIGVVAGAAVGLGLFFLNNQPAPQTEKSKGVVGVISDDWDTGVSEAPDASGAEQQSKSGTKIPGYSTAVMKEGDKTLALRVGNPKENRVGMIATLMLDDGTVLYTSPFLEPGQGLEEIPLEKTLPQGEYNAMVLYQCYLLDDEQTSLNAAQSAFKLIVS